MFAMTMLSVINKIEMDKRTVLRDSEVQEIKERLDTRRKVRDDEATVFNKRIAALEKELKDAKMTQPASQPTSRPIAK